MYLNTRRRQLSTGARIALGLALIALVAGLLVIGFAGPSSATETPHPTTTSAPHGEEDDGCDHGASGKPCKDDPEPDHGKDCETHGNHGGVNEDHCGESTGTPTGTTTTTPSGTTTTTPSGTTSTSPTTPYTPPSTSTGTHTKNPVTVKPRHTAQPRPTGGIKNPVGVRPHRTTTPPAAPAPVVDQPELPRTGPISPEALWLGVLALVLGLGSWAIMPRTRRH